MKYVRFPENRFLAVYPCLIAICGGNRPAGKLLGVLLFRHELRVENKDDAENQNAIKAARGELPDQDTSFRIYRKQEQLVDDMCGEMTEKTLHDTASPMLQLLGYLDIEEHMNANCYIVNINRVQAALDLYIPGQDEQPQLEKFLITHAQLEKFLITPSELEKVLIDKKNFQSQLEKVLIQNRKSSNLRRGRRPRSEAASKGESETPKNLEEDSKNDIEEEGEARPSASASDAPASSGILMDYAAGVKRITDSKLKAARPFMATQRAALFVDVGVDVEGDAASAAFDHDAPTEKAPTPHEVKAALTERTPTHGQQYPTGNRVHRGSDSAGDHPLPDLSHHEGLGSSQQTPLPGSSHGAGAAHPSGQASDGAAPARIPPATSPSPSAGASEPRASGGRPLVTREPKKPEASQPPLRFESEPKPLSEKQLRARYELQAWQAIEDVRRERGLKPPYGKAWKALKENQSGLDGLYVDDVPIEDIRRGYVAMLEDDDTWLARNFTMSAFYKRLPGLLDAKPGKRNGKSEPPPRQDWTVDDPPADDDYSIPALRWRKAHASELLARMGA